MTPVYLILLVAAAVCFGLAAFMGAGRPTGRIRVDLIATGLFCWVLVPLIQTFRAL